MKRYDLNSVGSRGRTRGAKPAQDLSVTINKDTSRMYFTSKLVFTFGLLERGVVIEFDDNGKWLLIISDSKTAIPVKAYRDGFYIEARNLVQDMLTFFLAERSMKFSLVQGLGEEDVVRLTMVPEDQKKSSFPRYKRKSKGFAGRPEIRLFQVI